VKKIFRVIIVGVAFGAMSAGLWEMKVELELSQGPNEKDIAERQTFNVSHKNLESKVLEQLVPVDLEALDKKDSVNKKNRFFKLDEKVLLSQAETNEKEAILKDLDLMQDQIALLLDTSKTTLENLESQQAIRMDAIHLLTRAMDWESNPKSGEIKQMVGDFILTENIKGLTNEKIRKSFIADKVELFANLKSVDYQKGLEVESRSPSSLISRTLQFANNFYILNENHRSSK